MANWKIMLGAMATAVGCNAAGAAPEYPQRPVRMIVGLPPGGTTDVMARIVSAKLSERLGQQVVVDNRTGANGIIGIQALVSSQPDGHTLIMSSGSWGTLGTLFKLPFDLQKDTVGIALIGTSPYVVVVQSALPVKTITDLAAYARANPGKLDYGASTPSSLQRLSGEMLKRAAGFDMLFVPYKGTGQMMPDLLGGRLHVVIDNVLILTPYIRKNTLRALGVTSSKRSVVFPELPTLAETGVPGFHAVGWFGVFAAAKTPAAIVGRLNTDLTALMQDPPTRERLLGQGAEPMTGTPEDTRKYLANEITTWSRVIREAGIKAE